MTGESFYKLKQIDQVLFLTSYLEHILGCKYLIPILIVAITNFQIIESTTGRRLYIHIGDFKSHLITRDALNSAINQKFEKCVRVKFY